MKKNHDNLSFIILSVGLSTLLHLLFWFLASGVLVQATPEWETRQHPDRRMEVRTLDLRDLVMSPTRRRPMMKEHLFEQQVKILQELFEKEGLLQQPEPTLKPVLRGLGRDILKPNDKARNKEMLPLTTAPPEIIAIDAEDLPAERLLSNRRWIPDVNRIGSGRNPMASIVAPGLGGGGVSEELLTLGMLMRPPALPSFDTGLRGRALALPIPDDLAMLGDGHSSPGILDPALDVELSVFYDKKEGGGYFRIDIEMNEAGDSLKPIPKDILFFVDSSSSITERKLAHFRKGLIRALVYIGPSDRFNVVAFRDTHFPLFKGFRKLDDETRRQAVAFISSLRSVGKTNVHDAIAPYVARGRLEHERPLLMFLISDGRTTTGSVVENEDIIRRVFRGNTDNASIFSFSGGSNTNLFLMDLLSYKNRGFSMHQPHLEHMDRELTSYIGSLSDIVVADLKCNVSGDLKKEVYPRNLQHLFRGFPLTVYGRFPEGAKDVTVRIEGRDRSGKPMDLVIHRDLANGIRAKADLPARWAAQKIYYLVGERVMKNRPELSKEIKRLARKYHIIVPY